MPLPSISRDELFRFLRFAIVGIVNTAITLALYWILRWFGVGINWANFLSYAAGMVNSFVCNRIWVFRSHGRRWLREAALFYAGCALCWVVQWCAFHLLLTVLPEAWAQLIGMGIYTLLGFIYNRCIAFH